MSNQNSQALDPRISQIPINITVQLGDKTLTVEQIYQLTNGSVIELNQLAGDNLKILANGKVIAYGEVVVVNDKYGIKVTETVNSHNKPIV